MRDSTYTFFDLMDGKVDSLPVDQVFQIHIPKAGGTSVTALFQRNDYQPLIFDMVQETFFHTISRENWEYAKSNLRPRKRALHLMAGHYRLDNPLLKTSHPHAIVTLLRDPIERALSHFNFTAAVEGNPWHTEVLNGTMSFIDYVSWLVAPNSVGPQYSFFDDTGNGSFAYTGTASAKTCFSNLSSKVGVFGLTEFFDEFAVTAGLLLGLNDLLALSLRNETLAFTKSVHPSVKRNLSDDERSHVENLLGDDIWFYSEARKLYEYRRAHPKISSVLDEALPILKRANADLKALHAITDPDDPQRFAFAGTTRLRRKLDPKQGAY